MKTLTDFQLSCGQVQQTKIKADKIELYKEHSIFHVRRFSDSICGRKVQEAWLCFKKIHEARKAFNRQCEIAKAVNS